MNTLKQNAIHGSLARLCALGTSIIIRTASLLALVRILSPNDFGLIGMVMALTGVLIVFRDFGLSAAAIQRPDITDEQISTLFWVNIAVGFLLSLIGVAAAPLVAAYYNRPELLYVTVCLVFAFFINSAGVQHCAMLQRQMRFVSLSVIDVISLASGSGIAIVFGAAGFGYWALVAMAVATPLTATSGYWWVSKWVPGPPDVRAEIRPLLRFGSILTLNGVVAYAAYNAEKVMIGRVWGASAIGLYGRAHQLLNLPVDSLNSAIGEVAFSALSRLQNDPARLKSYFLKGFSLVLTSTLPVAIVCTLFASDIVNVLLGPQWKDAAEIVRLLAPTVAIRAIINPIGWLLYSIGLVERSLRIALVFAPIMITGCYIGLPYGAVGVAIAYSIVMGLWLIPHILWCVHGTPISGYDILRIVGRLLMPGIVAGGIAYIVSGLCGDLLVPVARLATESIAFLLAYFPLLWFIAGQKSLYTDLFRGLQARVRPAVN